MSTSSSAIFGSNAAHVAVFKNGRKKVLLTRKNNIPLWVLPGGHLEKGESFEEAAIREYREETGLVIKIIGLKAIYRHKKGFEKRVYEGKIIEGKLKINHECQSVGWFNLDKLPQPTTLYEKQRIKDSLKLNKEIVRRDLAVHIRWEIIYQLEHPLILLQLFYFFVKDFVVKSFK